MFVRSFLIIIALVLSGCATSYQIDGFTGGQKPKWRSADVLEIEASGNGYTSSSKLERMTLLRAAETAIEANYRYFIEIDSEDTSRETTINLPATQTTNVTGQYTGSGYTGTSTTTYANNSYDVYKPGANVRYRMFEELPPDARPGQFYDAYEVYNRLGKKYIKKFKPKYPPTD